MTTVAFWIGAVIVLAIVGTPVVYGQWPTLALLLPPMLLIAWLLWLVLYHPSVRYDERGAVVTNMGRVHVLPWPRVTGVRQSLNLVFEVEKGERVQAWGSPPPKHTGNLLRNLDRKTRPTEDFHQVADLLEQFRRAAAPSSAPAESRFDVVALAIGAVLAAAVVVEVVVRLAVA